jgi:hypothetical protein
VKGVTPTRKANSLKLISRNIRAAGKLAERSIREKVAEVDASEVESGAVQRAVRSGAETAKNTAKIARRLYAGSKAKRRISSPEEDGMEPGSTYRRGEYVFPKGLAGLSYGDPDAKRDHRQTTNGTYIYRNRQKAVHTETQAGKRRAAASTQKTAKPAAAKRGAKKTAKPAAAKRGAKKTGAAIQRRFASIGKSFAGGFKWLLPVSLPMVAIILVVIILMGALISVISPLGFFFSDNKADNSYSINNIINRVSQDWYDELAAQREHYESMGYIVNVSYNTGAGDGVERVDNWKDVLALYIVQNTGKDKSMIELNEADESGIKELFFNMNPINISTRVEQVEEEGETEEVQYADVSVSNLRYVQMLNKYPLDSFQNDMIDFLMRPDMNATWADMGIDFGGNMTTNIDVNAIIHDLPAGSLGSVIVQAALSRLGDPYSMELRGQGNYVDCSYFTQWAYAQAGVSIPGTAAEQAQYCVQVGKTISGNLLQAGDLIFWSYPSNPRVAGRFMDIGHVAIYVQNGMMIEAAPSAGCVTYRAVSVQGEPTLYGRLLT